MEKLSTIYTLYVFAFAIVTPMARSSFNKKPDAVLSWFNNLPNSKEKLVQLHFYLHDIIGGENPSSYTVLAPEISTTSPTKFGLTRMMDDTLSVGPEPDSKIIGRVKGSNIQTSLEEGNLLMALSFLFTDGEYNCSTLSVLALNPFLDEYREWPIVGGSGVFRLARGILTARTVWHNLTTDDAVLEMTATVLHYA